MTERLRLLAVHAHPDDESSKGAGTMMKYRAEGVDVVVATCTGGERGSILNPRLDRPEVHADIFSIRRAEMDRARAILGVRQTWLGFVDSGMPTDDVRQSLPDGCFARQPLEVASAPLVRLIRFFRPHVILTYDEDGGYPHPDHVMCHKISVEAFDTAGDPDRYVGMGDPWQPLKLYYHMTFTRDRILALHEATMAAGLASPYADWLRRWDTLEDKSARITTRIVCDEYFEARDEALRAHATQVDPDGMWFAVPLWIQRQVWPTEDFELVRSFVGDTPGSGRFSLEDDLFAGVRGCALV